MQHRRDIRSWGRPYENQGQDITGFEYLNRWFAAMRERPAVQRAYARADEVKAKFEPVDEEESHRILFAQR